MLIKHYGGNTFLKLIPADKPILKCFAHFPVWYVWLVLAGFLSLSVGQGCWETILNQQQNLQTRLGWFKLFQLLSGHFVRKAFITYYDTF